MASSKTKVITLVVLGIFLALGIGVGIRYGVEKRTTRTFQPIAPSVPGISQEVASQTAPIACGNDMDCLIAAAQSCTVANAVQDNALTVEFFGFLSSSSYYYEIQGPANGKCVLYQRLTKQEVGFSNEARQAALASGSTADELNAVEVKARNEARTLEGKDLTCKFASPDLVARLRKWKAGTFDFGETNCALTPSGESQCTTTGGDYSVGECIGTLLES